jgi:hypothetical protein
MDKAILSNLLFFINTNRLRRSRNSIQAKSKEIIPLRFIINLLISLQEAMR